MNPARLLLIFSVALFVLAASGLHIGSFILVRLGLAAVAASFLL